MRDEARVAVPEGSRAIVAVTPARAGCVDVELECGHRLRRRFGLCVPNRLVCPECRSERPAREAD